MTDTPQRPPLPDRLSVDTRNPHYVAAVCEHEIGIRLNDNERKDYKRAFVGNLASRRVSRLVYLPPCDLLDNGGVAYLNQITHAHVSAFKGIARRCALSVYGLRDLEYAIENHLLRPKADELGFAQAAR